MKSGHIWLPLLEDKLLYVPELCALNMLKELVSQHLGSTYSSFEIVLARANGQTLVKLEGELGEERELFVFSLTGWQKWNLIQKNDSSAKIRRRALKYFPSFEFFDEPGRIDALEKVLKEEDSQVLRNNAISQKIVLLERGPNPGIDSDDKNHGLWNSTADQLNRVQTWKNPKSGKCIRTVVHDWMKETVVMESERENTHFHLIAIAESFNVRVIIILSLFSERLCIVVLPGKTATTDVLRTIWLGFEKRFYSLTRAAVAPRTIQLLKLKSHDKEYECISLVKLSSPKIFDTERWCLDEDVLQKFVERKALPLLEFENHRRLIILGASEELLLLVAKGPAT